MVLVVVGLPFATCFGLVPHQANCSGKQGRVVREDSDCLCVVGGDRHLSLCVVGGDRHLSLCVVRVRFITGLFPSSHMGTHCSTAVVAVDCKSKPGPGFEPWLEFFCDLNFLTLSKGYQSGATIDNTPF